jgi:hypothetical protein
MYSIRLLNAASRELERLDKPIAQGLSVAFVGLPKTLIL